MDALTATFARFRHNGDLDALGRVFDAVAPRLLALALHLTGNAADAEDALQATFVVAMRKATVFDTQQSVAAWLAGILAGEAKNVRRREQRRQTESLPENLSANDGDALAAAEHRDLVTQLRTRIDVLPAEQRQVLLLQLQHGLQPAEIAEVLGAAPGTIRMRIHRGMAALRKTLPAGMALGAIALFPQRGIAAVRACVMEVGAVEAAAATTAVAVTIGGLAMKKVSLAAVALATISLVWWAVSPPDLAGVPEQPSKGAVAESATIGNVDDADEATASASRDVAGAEDRDLVQVAPGGLRVTVRADKATQVGPMLQEVDSSDGSGVPLSGVLLELWPGHLESGPIDGLPRAMQTDVHGVVRFDELLPGPYRLAVLAGDRRLGGVRSVEIHGDVIQMLEIHCAYTDTITGRVVDERGAVVAGAQIWVGKRLSYETSPARSLRVAAVSAVDGTFRLAHVRDEEYVAASKHGYGASWSHPIQQLGGGDIELVLGSKSGGVAGIVVDQDGQPIPGVWISVEPHDERLRRAMDGTLLGPRLGVYAQTDAGGRFVIDGLAPGRYSCKARRRPLASATAEPLVVAGARRDLRLVMTRRAAVHGYLRDSQGKAVAGCYVMRAGQGRGVQTTRSNFDGSYRFEGVKYEPFTLSAIRMASGARVEKKVAAPTSTETRVDLVLDEKPALSGSAATESGRALSGWHVTVFAGGDPQQSHRTQTRSDGAFAIWGLPAGQHRVRLHRDEASAMDPDLSVFGEVGTAVRLVVGDEMLPHATVRGRVVDDQGRVVAGAWVWLPESTALEEPTVDPDGSFVRAEVNPGRHQMEFGAPGCVGGQRAIDVQPGDDRDVGDLVLLRGATLRVRYLRPDGRPWLGRPPLPWLHKGGNWLRAGDIDYAIDGDEVVVTRIPAGAYDVQGPYGDELLIGSVQVDLRAGEVRRLEVSVEVGRRRTMTFAARETDRGLHVVVKRGDGLVVLDRKIHKVAGELQLSEVLPIGDFRVEASNEVGSRFAGEIHVAADVVAGGVTERIAIPRIK